MKPARDVLGRLDSTDVTIDDAFWNPRLEANREVVLEYQYEQLEESGALENFRVAADDRDGDFQGMRFADSDAYKWLEATSYTYENDPDPALEERMDEVIDLIAAAQEPDGYLNTYFTIEEPGARWTNLGEMHELYCAGHLFEAAVAHHRATGSDRLLSVALDFADHVDETFGPDARRGYPGHEEIETGLVRLYRVTGETRYLDLAQYFLDERGQEPSVFERELATFEADDRAGNPKWYRYLFEDKAGEYDGSYAQDHTPIREQETVEGHAVRATYLYMGMADVAMETDDESLYETLETLWQNMTRKRMYVTGGIGSSHDGERFTDDYDLPNDTAYAETCAAVGSVFWNERMQRITREARFADELERALYNGFLAGVSLDGTEFFYVNPLESDGDHHRKGWFTCACCPPNVARLLASLDEYVYTVTQDERELFVNLYLGSTGTIRPDGTEVTVTQQTDYPWDGAVSLEVSTPEPVTFDLHLRVPEWCRNLTLTVDGEDRSVDPDAGYVTVGRSWEDGDAVSVEFEMDVECLRAHPNVTNDTGRVALQRGPVVFCLEETDNRAPLSNVVVDEESIEATESDVLEGVTVLEGSGRYTPPDVWENRLYQREEGITSEPVDVTAIPYYAWDNREPGEMLVWLRTD